MIKKWINHPTPLLILDFLFIFFQDGAEQDEPEELDFMFDEEMEQMDGRRNTFTDWSDEETDGEIDDQDVNKILIVTQTPPYLRKHPGGDRTGHHTSRAKLSTELVKVINDGLFYYEQDLWDDTYEPEYATIKVRSFFMVESMKKGVFCILWSSLLTVITCLSLKIFRSWFRKLPQEVKISLLETSLGVFLL